ncbi:MAG TPA: SRPBCC domain-containing protein [Segetibacter sp.]|jgi:uncharacterized protein YndB with AHSA1/START domain
MEKTKVVGQTKDAGFQIGVRKTFAVPAETVWNFLFSEKGLSTWLGKTSLENFELGKIYKTEEEIEGKVNIFKLNSHIRLTWKPKHWTNTSALQIRVIPSNEKTTISFHQDKLLDSKQRDEMKKYWDEVIEKIENEILNSINKQA